MKKEVQGYNGELLLGDSVHDYAQEVMVAAHGSVVKDSSSEEEMVRVLDGRLRESEGMGFF